MNFTDWYEQNADVLLHLPPRAQALIAWAASEMRTALQVIAPRSHQPKGGMCMTCERRADDCSALPFERMPRIEAIAGGVVVVRCTAHARIRDALS